MEPISQPSIAELTKKIAELSAQLEMRKASVKAELRNRFDELLAENALSISDIYPELFKRMAHRVRKNPRGPALPKYKNPDTEETWSGRGRTPGWVSKLLEVRGITLDEFKKSLDFGT